MPKVGFICTGFDYTDMVKELEGKFSKENLIKIFKESGEVAYRVAYMLCPVDTGWMRGQLYLKFQGDSIFILGNDAEYAIYNEYGWSGIPEVPNPPDFKFYKGGFRPFMRIGLIRSEEYFKRRLADIVEK